VKTDNPVINLAYEQAVVAILNACPQATEQQAEAAIDAIAELIFTTIDQYMEHKNDTAH